MAEHYLFVFGELFESGRDNVVHTALREVPTEYGTLLVFSRKEHGLPVTPVMRLVGQAGTNSRGHGQYIVEELPQDDRHATAKILAGRRIEGPFDFDVASYATPLAEQPEDVVN